MSHGVRRRSGVAGGLVVVVILVLMACSDPGGQGNGCQSTGADQIINAQDNLTFDRPNIDVTAGERVCWQNLGTVSHTVTATANPADSLWNLDAQLNPNLVVLYRFNRIGDFAYHCTFHQGTGMTGMIHVR